MNAEDISLNYYQIRDKKGHSKDIHMAKMDIVDKCNRTDITMIKT